MLEIHAAPGPPRLQSVVHEGRRLAELEVVVGGSAGAVRWPGRAWTVQGGTTPGSWHVRDGDTPVAALWRPVPLAERFHLRLDREQGAAFEVRPTGGLARRRWAVLDERGRCQLEVVQRLLARPVHDLRLRSGDVPTDLAMLVAWLLATVTGPPRVPPRPRVVH